MKKIIALVCLGLGTLSCNTTKTSPAFEMGVMVADQFITMNMMFMGIPPTGSMCMLLEGKKAGMTKQDLIDLMQGNIKEDSEKAKVFNKVFAECKKQYEDTYKKEVEETKGK